MPICLHLRGRKRSLYFKLHFAIGFLEVFSFACLFNQQNCQFYYAVVIGFTRWGWKFFQFDQTFSFSSHLTTWQFQTAVGLNILQMICCFGWILSWQLCYSVVKFFPLWHIAGYLKRLVFNRLMCSVQLSGHWPTNNCLQTPLRIFNFVFIHALIESQDDLSTSWRWSFNILFYLSKLVISCFMSLVLVCFIVAPDPESTNMMVGQLFILHLIIIFRDSVPLYLVWRCLCKEVPLISIPTEWSIWSPVKWGEMSCVSIF